MRTLTETLNSRPFNKLLIAIEDLIAKAISENFGTTALAEVSTERQQVQRVIRDIKDGSVVAILDAAKYGFSLERAFEELVTLEAIRDEIAADIPISYARCGKDEWRSAIESAVRYSGLAGTLSRALASSGSAPVSDVSDSKKTLCLSAAVLSVLGLVVDLIAMFFWDWWFYQDSDPKPSKKVMIGVIGLQFVVIVLAFIDAGLAYKECISG